MLLIRLRSLGNFDIAKLSLNDFFDKKIFFVEKEEMEKVSNYLENFYFFFFSRGNFFVKKVI